jgi:methylated-DNA-[protein]-cysteine S-methyltransferase
MQYRFICNGGEEVEVISGFTRFELWFVEVLWSGDRVYRVRFSRTRPPEEGPVPYQVQQYLSGRSADLSQLKPAFSPPGALYAEIYREVSSIPYGETATYGEIAFRVGTGPRVVGQAMARNPVPLIIPCHRVVAKKGLGGFSPDLEIKVRLLSMEQKNKKRFMKKSDFSAPRNQGEDS